jgi:hypothetical protein
MKSFCVVAAIFLLAVGCNYSTSAKQLSKSDIEAKLAKSQKWHDVSLTDVSDGRFTGSAVTETGEKIAVEVKQTPNSLSTDWKHSDGSDGGHSEESGWQVSVHVE